jgi:hypothetical protein
MRKKIFHTLLLCLFAVFSMSALAQKTVTGVVADDSGELLPGASVVRCIFCSCNIFRRYGEAGDNCREPKQP